MSVLVGLFLMALVVAGQNYDSFQGLKLLSRTNVSFLI